MSVDAQPQAPSVEQSAVGPRILAEPRLPSNASGMAQVAAATAAALSGAKVVEMAEFFHNMKDPLFAAALQRLCQSRGIADIGGFFRVSPELRTSMTNAVKEYVRMSVGKTSGPA